MAFEADLVLKLTVNFTLSFCYEVENVLILSGAHITVRSHQVDKIKSVLVCALLADKLILFKRFFLRFVALFINVFNFFFFLRSFFIDHDLFKIVTRKVT